MQLVLHAGVHMTDEDRLVKSLLKNRDMLQPRAVAVPGPSRYRRPLRDAMAALSKAPPLPGAREDFLDQVLDNDHAERMVLSNDNFFCVPKLAISGGKFYDKAEAKLADLREFFAGDEVELMFAIRDPATYLPAIYGASPEADFEAFLGTTNPRTLRWSELIGRIRASLPDIRITVWCNEDTPMLWGHVIRAAAGLAPGDRIIGALDVLREIMSKEGAMRLKAYLDSNPALDEPHRQQVIAAFLDKYVLDDAMEEDVSLPGWDEALIEDLGQVYDEDIERIAEMPGVTFLSA